MIVNKKLDRFKQWAGERMGGEVKTNVSDDVKALETEMQLRHEGMDRLQTSMTAYIKSISKRSELGSDREKNLPIAFLGATMVGHGNEFEDDSIFGACLIGMGRANEKIAKQQETFVSKATDSWLDSLERSLAQMKEYQAARKKLESRRLAYDTSSTKMNKSKKEDFRLEEEMRTQRAKYDEANEEIRRRMQDIKEAESESVADLSAFLEAELEYYTNCRDILMNLKRNWPAGQPEQIARTRPRSNTARSFSERSQPEEPPAPEPRPSIRSQRTVSSRLSAYDDEEDDRRPRHQLTRSHTQQDDYYPSARYREGSPMTMPRLQRVPTDPSVVNSARSNLRTVPRLATDDDVFSDPRSNDSFASGTDRIPRDIAESPQSASAEWAPRSASGSGYNSPSIGGRRPPPAPPIRKKPPPPPPPGKKPVFN